MFEKQRLRKKAKEVKRQHLEFVNPDGTFFEEVGAADRSEVLMYEKLREESASIYLLETVVEKIAHVTIGILACIGVLTLICEGSRTELIVFLKEISMLIGFSL